MIGMSTPNSLPLAGAPLDRPPVLEPCAIRLSAVAPTPALVSRTRLAAATSPLPWHVGMVALRGEDREHVATEAHARLERRAALRSDEERDLALLVGEQRRAIDRANAALFGIALGDAEDQRVRLPLRQPGLLRREERDRARDRVVEDDRREIGRQRHARAVDDADRLPIHRRREADSDRTRSGSRRRPVAAGRARR